MFICCKKRTFECRYCDRDDFTSQKGARWHEVKWCKVRSKQLDEKFTNRNKEWTEEEEGKMIALLGTRSDSAQETFESKFYKEVGEILGRSPTAISKRFNKILFKNREYDYGEILTKYHITCRYNKKAIKKYCDYHQWYTLNNKDTGTIGDIVKETVKDSKENKSL